MHPALSGLIIDFFYSGSNAMGSLFPEVFATKVPRATVVLTATAVVTFFEIILSCTDSFCID